MQPFKAPTASVMLQEASSHISAGRFATAISTLESILRKSPGEFEALNMLASAYLSLGRNSDCRRVAERAIRLRPRDPRPYHQVAQSLRQEGRLTDVDRILEKGLRECGAHPLLVAEQVERLITAAEYQAAYDACRPALEAGASEPHFVLAAANACLRAGRPDEGAALLRKCLEGSELLPGARSALLYMLSEILDSAGDYDGAFLALREANDLKNAPPDLQAQTRAMDDYIRAWGREAVESLPRGRATDLPVFIVGFWRSGTTIIEQTLSSHPQVFGGGELSLVMQFAHEKREAGGPPLISNPASITTGQVERFSRAYLGHLRRLSSAASRVTDKLPPNFMYLGLIQALFPGARVIHCLRDPVDTCVSCYFNMRGALNYTHDLRALGSFYRDYKRLMAHWRSVLEIPILDMRYEDFVADQETSARKAVEFIGLSWDDRCLRPQENKRIAMTRSIHQVRKPVYGSSVARWKRYERHLGPLLEALGDEADRPASNPD